MDGTLPSSCGQLNVAEWNEAQVPRLVSIRFSTSFRSYSTSAYAVQTSEVFKPSEVSRGSDRYQIAVVEAVIPENDFPSRKWYDLVENRSGIHERVELSILAARVNAKR